MNTHHDLIPADHTPAKYLAAAQPAAGRYAAGAARPLVSAYLAGYPGAFCDSVDAPEWVRRIARYHRDEARANARCQFRAADAVTARLRGRGKGQRAVNFRFIQALDGKALAGAQNYSNCVAWCTREIVACIWGALVAAGLKRYEKRPGTACPYASRGYGDDSGMSCWTAANFVHVRGVQLETIYGGNDLSTEELDEKAGVRWGGRGIPREVLEAIAGDRIDQVSEIDADPELVKDILFGGHFISTGSTVTAGGPGDPISPRGPVGPHAQACIGYDDTDEFRDWYKQTTGKTVDWVLLFDQSWGDWLEVQNWPDHLWGPRPQGAFVLRGADGLRLMSGNGDGIAMGGLLGFDLLTLPAGLDVSGWLGK